MTAFTSPWSRRRASSVVLRRERMRARRARPSPVNAVKQDTYHSVATSARAEHETSRSRMSHASPTAWNRGARPRGVRDGVALLHRRRRTRGEAPIRAIVAEQATAWDVWRRTRTCPALLRQTCRSTNIFGMVMYGAAAFGEASTRRSSPRFYKGTDQASPHPPDSIRHCRTSPSWTSITKCGA